MDKLTEEYLIRKSAMITLNTKPIKEVYKMDKTTLGSGTYGTVKKVTHL